MSELEKGIAFPAAGQQAAPATHPADLIDAESPYIVRWGWKEAGMAALGTALASGLAIGLAAWSSPLWLISLAMILPVGGLGVLFFRNPRRKIPDGPGILVAPADGRIVEVGTVVEEEYIAGPALKVSIFLSIFDVHLNRAPCSGRVEHLVHRDGQHLDARNPLCASQNERQSIGLARGEPWGAPGAKVLVRQISGAIARRIVCPLRAGQAVERGRLIGMIKYGSRTEILVSTPPGIARLEALVKVGEKVRAGESVLFRYADPNH
jgi:phosphatidylserine decarboxylase